MVLATLQKAINVLNSCININAINVIIRLLEGYFQVIPVYLIITLLQIKIAVASLRSKGIISVTANITKLKRTIL